MAKEKDEEGAIISWSDRVDELEEKVAYWVSITQDLPKNERKYYKAKDPMSKDPREIDLWQREEIRRIKEGHFGMNGKMYFWYNYVMMDKVGHGLVSPEYRVCQQEWFRVIEECQKSREYGLICVKRRRIGASWMEAADVLHDCITTPHFRVGMTSKTKEDAIDLFKKVKFIYDHLPDWLRPAMLSDTITNVEFGWKKKDSRGNKIKAGLRSSIQIKAPTETSWEGGALWKLILDEAGKTANLKQIFSYADDTMMVGTKRVGTPIVFGTSGDITKEGIELMGLWKDADTRRLKRFFLAGYMGIDGLVDKFGNDMKEDAIRWIVYKRKEYESLSSKDYTDFIQKYPLTVEEAFSSSETYGLGNQIKINRQYQSLSMNPAKTKKGYFRLGTDGKPTFTPDPRGKAIIYEEPEEHYKNLYLAGNDPVDAETEAKDASSIATYIMKKAHGTMPPKIVFEYVDRPPIPRDAYEQVIMALQYYNNTKVMVERNKYGMITYFDERGCKHLLQTAPQGLNRIVSGHTMQIGYYATKAVIQHGEELISEYIEDYCDYIPSLELLDELRKYGMQNTDRVSALMATLIFLREDKTVSKEVKELLKHIPDWNYKRVNGKIKLVR